MGESIKKKRINIEVDTKDDGCFTIKCSMGLLKKHDMVAETVDSCIDKVSGFLRKELPANTT